MKTLESKLMIPISIQVCLVFLILFGCNEHMNDNGLGNNMSQDETVATLNDILNQLDFESGILIVENDFSIQDAINVAVPGNAIYIEPGKYKEALKVNKPGLKLIGLGISSDESVILEEPGNGNKSISLSPEVNNVEVLNIKSQDLKDERIRLKTGGKSAVKMVRKNTRTELGNGIVHYVYELRFGYGEFDIVRVHRVVKEQRPYKPVHTKGNVFMVHGSIQDFDDIFLSAGAESIDSKTSIPFYLAEKYIDVWGIDLGWNLVPVETADFEFMKDWGIDRDRDHTLAALIFARLVRGLTGQGFGKMNLLGFSYGVYIAYGAAGKETQLHPILQCIKGIIPVDHALKYAPEETELISRACEVAAGVKDQLNSGIYQATDGQTFITLGGFALDAPDEISPVPDFAALGFTNSQVLNFLSTTTYAVSPTVAPFWHFFGGDVNGMLYTDPLRFYRLAVVLAPYQPLLHDYETSACFCDDEEVSIDDNLGGIKVPIFYLGAAGGIGSLGIYTTTLTSSSDISSYIISIPGTETAMDYGHADLFMGKEASTLVWNELYQWLVNH